MKKNGEKYRIGVICAAPSAQMSGQYDALASLTDYEFILLFKYPQSSNPAWGKVEPKKVKWEVLPQLPSWLPSRMKRFVNGNITHVLEKYDFDGMILHGIYDSTAILQAQRWCRKNGRPCLLRCDANILEEQRFSWFKRLRHRILIGDKIKTSDALLTIGDNNSKYYENFGGTRDKLFLAPWEIDYDVLENAYEKALPKRQELRHILGIDDDTFVISSIARMFLYKGFDLLICAASRLEAEGYKIKMFFAGSGHDEEIIKRKVCQYNAPVEMTGNLSRQKLVELLVSSDAFTLMSTFEPWGLVVNEACLCGLPLILANQVGVAANLLKNDANGWSVPALDMEQFCGCVKKLINNRELCMKFGQASRNIYLDWTMTNSAAKGYKDALNFILKNYSCF